MRPTLGLNERPQSEEEAQQVIERIRFKRGDYGQKGEAELNKNSLEWREMFKEDMEDRRTDIANFARTYV